MSTIDPKEQQQQEKSIDLSFSADAFEALVTAVPSCLAHVSSFVVEHAAPEVLERPVEVGVVLPLKARSDTYIRFAGIAEQSIDGFEFSRGGYIYLHVWTDDQGFKTLKLTWESHGPTHFRISKATIIDVAVDPKQRSIEQLMSQFRSFRGILGDSSSTSREPSKPLLSMRGGSLGGWPGSRQRPAGELL